MMPGMSEEEAVTGPVKIGETDPLASAEAWETLTDQTQTFSITLPRGWRNELGVVPTPLMKHSVARSTSPDGVTSFRIGDPGLPLFMEPGYAGYGVPPGATVRPATPAHQLVAEWTQFQFGRAPGLRVLSVTEFPPALQLFVEATRRAGAPAMWATAARLDAEITESGRPLRIAVVMTTGSAVPSAWFAQVYAVTSAGDPGPLVPALLRVITSLGVTDAERQRLTNERMASAAAHQTTMAQINANSAILAANHQHNMANIDNSARAHQARMADLQYAGDMQMQSWQQQQQVSDGQHAAAMSGLRPDMADPALSGSPQQDFVNMIREERTVIDGNGDAHQVQAGYDKYYYRRHDDSWIKLPAHQNLADVPGIDPDDYEETRIQS